MTANKIFIWPGQSRLLQEKEKLTIVDFAGIGSGKSKFAPRWQLLRNEWNQGSSSKKACYLAPNYKLLKMHCVPNYKAALEERGFMEDVHWSFNKTDMCINYNPQRMFPYQVFFLSADNYTKFVNWEFDSTVWEEPGFCPEEMADFVAQRTGRSPGVKCGQVYMAGVIQKPNWYYDRFGPREDLLEGEKYRLPQWVDDVAPGWGGKVLTRFRESETTLVRHASTYENRLLTKSYLKRLWEQCSWSDHYFKAHVIGLPLAINKNAVYWAFDDAEQVGDYKPDFKGETPHIDLSFDFNYGQMSVIALQEYEGDHYVVWENSTRSKVTEDACLEFIKAFPPHKFGNRIIRVYGDASGYARSPQLRTKDGSYSIIEHVLKPHYARVRIAAPRHTLLQEIRTDATNKLLANTSKKKSPGLHIDKSCRRLITGLRSVAWGDDGKIAKGSGDEITHVPEALDFRNYTVCPPIDLGDRTASFNFVG